MRKMARKLVFHDFFDYLMGLIIVFNLVVMIIETDRTVAPEENDEGTIHWTEIFGWAALMIFILELICRLLALGCRFWKDLWNIFDFVIVAVDAVFSVIGLVAGDAFPVSILRIFRLAKLARVSKVLRVFPELRLLLAGLMGSISAIFWGTVLLFLCLLVWSMIGVLFIHPLNIKIDYANSCERCPRAYSSVMQATLTFWQAIVAGDSWGQVTIPLMERHPVTALFFIPMFLSVGMAVMNLIVGVVVSVAQQAKDNLEAEDSKERILSKLERQTHLLDLCQQFDAQGTGRLSRQQTYERFSEPGEFRDAILSMEITEEDFDIIWTIIDPDKTGIVQYKDLVSHLYSIRNSDSQFMLAYVKYYITMIRNALLDKMEDHHAERMSLEQKESSSVQDETEEAGCIDEQVVQQVQVARRQMTETVQVVERQMTGKSNRPSLNRRSSKVVEPITTTLEKLKSQNDFIQTWFDQVGNDIATMRAELKDMMDVRHEMYHPPLPSSVDEDILLTKAPVDVIIELKDVLLDINRKLGDPASLPSTSCGLLPQCSAGSEWKSVLPNERRTSEILVQSKTIYPSKRFMRL